MKPDRRLVLATVFWLFAMVRVTQAIQWNLAHDHDDFLVFYRSAACLRLGCDPYGLSATYPPQSAPPFVLRLISPFTLLSVDTAYWLWLLLTALSMAGALRIITHEAPELPWRFALPLIIGALPVLATVAAGQLAGLLTWPLAWLWQRDRHHRLPTWLFGPLVLSRLFLGLLAVLRSWRRLLPVIASGVVVVAFDLVIDGPARYRGWLLNLWFAAPSGNYKDGSIWQAAIRTCRPTEFFQPIGNCRTLEVWAVVPIVVIVLMASYARMRDADPDRAWLWGLCAGLLLSPKGWTHYSGWLLGPALLVYQSGDLIEKRCLLAVAAIMLLPPTLPMLGQPNRWLTPTLGALYGWCWMLGLMAAWRLPQRRVSQNGRTDPVRA